MSQPRRLAVLLLSAVVCMTALGPAQAQPAAPEDSVQVEVPRDERPGDLASDRVLVRYKDRTSAAEKAVVRDDNEVVRDAVVPLINAEIVEAVGEPDPRALAEDLESHPDVLYAEPDFAMASRNHGGGNAGDTEYPSQWGLNNTGQPGLGYREVERVDPVTGEPYIEGQSFAQSGIANVDINAPEAWSVTEGDGVVVAVIDDGVDFSHPDLDGNKWINVDEIANNNVDDDSNGFVDDVNGWDFCNATTRSDPKGETVYDGPGDSHGTAVASALASELNGAGIGTGIVGVAPRAKIMALKFGGVIEGGGDCAGSTLHAIEAINYATANGARISNNSWGGYNSSNALKDAIAASGQVFVGAAGNDANDNDLVPSYPDGYMLPNVISVAAVDNRGEMAAFSNFGANRVHVAAPGVGILTAAHGSTWSYDNGFGTSVAAPYVAGIAALLLHQMPQLTATQVVDLIKSTVTPLGSLTGKVSTGGMVNAAAALAGLAELGEFHPVTPTRIFDTRADQSHIKQPVVGSKVPLGENAEVVVQITGAQGPDSATQVVPTSGVSAVALNVTATNVTGGGFVTVYPHSSVSPIDRPTASNLNLTVGRTVPNHVVVPVGKDGKIRIFNRRANADIFVDVAGYFSNGHTTTAGGDRFYPVAPARIFDTRASQSDIKQPPLGSKVPLGNDGEVVVQITGAQGPTSSTPVIPTSGVSAVALNVTATNVTGGGFVTVYPHSPTSPADRPTASSLNLVTGLTVPNFVVVPVGTDGKIRVFNRRANADIFIDVAGYYGAPTPTVEHRMQPVPPARIFDTRASQSQIRQPASGSKVPLGENSEAVVQITGALDSAGTVVVPPGATAVALNVTATDVTGGGFVTVYPHSPTSPADRPTASNLNLISGQTTPNSVVVPIGTDGKIRIFNRRPSTNIFVDVAGYYWD